MKLSRGKANPKMVNEILKNLNNKYGEVAEWLKATVC